MSGIVAWRISSAHALIVARREGRSDPDAAWPARGALGDGRRRRQRPMESSPCASSRSPFNVRCRKPRSDGDATLFIQSLRDRLGRTVYQHVTRSSRADLWSSPEERLERCSRSRAALAADDRQDLLEPARAHRRSPRARGLPGRPSSLCVVKNALVKDCRSRHRGVVDAAHTGSRFAVRRMGRRHAAPVARRIGADETRERPCAMVAPRPARPGRSSILRRWIAHGRPAIEGGRRDDPQGAAPSQGTRRARSALES